MSLDWLENASDEELRAALKDVDEHAQCVTRWEAQFIESVLFKNKVTMTEKQRSVAKQIVRKYGD